MLYAITKSSLNAIIFFVIWFAHKVYGLDYVGTLLQGIPVNLLPDILRKYGAIIEGELSIKGGLRIDNAGDDLSNLRIGRKCYIGKGVL